jgi:hypothetical protein
VMLKMVGAADMLRLGRSRGSRHCTARPSSRAGSVSGENRG